MLKYPLNPFNSPVSGKVQDCAVFQPKRFFTSVAIKQATKQPIGMPTAVRGLAEEARLHTYSHTFNHVYKSAPVHHDIKEMSTHRFV